MLQFITNSPTVDGTVAQARLALEGGCRWIQVRMKDAPEDIVRQALEDIYPFAQEVGATVLVDDHVSLAVLSYVNGVHLGAKDMSPLEARKILGNDKIIGFTVNNADAVKSARNMPIDYIGLGPWRFTGTKKALAPVLGAEGVSEIMAEIRCTLGDIPVVVIGGIVADDIPAVLKTGADGVAVSGAISAAENPVEAAAQFINTLKSNKTKI